MLLLIFFSKSEPVTVVLLLVALFLFLRQKNTRPWLFTSSSALERSPLIPGAALVIAVTYTLVSHRYDPDDALYLFFGLLPLDQPMQAINLFPFYDTARMLVSYPTIEAVVSYWTGVNFLQVYYLVIPALAAMLCVLAYYGLFQRLGGNYAGVLTLMTVVILILWADQAPELPATDTFVRLYPGQVNILCSGLSLSPQFGNRCPDTSSLEVTFVWQWQASRVIGLTQSAIVLIPLFFHGLDCNSMDNLPGTARGGRATCLFWWALASFLALGAGMIGLPGENSHRTEC